MRQTKFLSQKRKKVIKRRDQEREEEKKKKRNESDQDFVFFWDRIKKTRKGAIQLVERNSLNRPKKLLRF